MQNRFEKHNIRIKKRWKNIFGYSFEELAGQFTLPGSITETSFKCTHCGKLLTKEEIAKNKQDIIKAKCDECITKSGKNADVPEYKEKNDE